MVSSKLLTADMKQSVSPQRAGGAGSGRYTVNKLGGSASHLYISQCICRAISQPLSQSASHPGSHRPGASPAPVSPRCPSWNLLMLHHWQTNVPTLKGRVCMWRTARADLHTEPDFKLSDLVSTSAMFCFHMVISELCGHSFYLSG